MPFFKFQAVVFDFDGVIVGAGGHLYRDTLHLIRSLYGNVPLHIASAANHSDLLRVCSQLGIFEYFVSIHGGPTPKYQLLSQLLLEYGYTAEATCLIGDSYSDYEAALHNGMQFFGYSNEALRDLSGSSGWFQSFPMLTLT
ncbi:MAG: HAD family hydrolase [Candidatus Cloacimonetes bacterium]|nr:HAD family hydrolase [Candidatus Cloacimonadota bacterium]